MRKVKYTVELYFGGEEPDQVLETNDIDIAREWVLTAEHGIILNEHGIAVQ